jgi:electron transport complex protein RnfG
MNDENQTPASSVQQPSSKSLIATMGGIATLSGLLVVVVYQATLPAILENRRLAIERAIFTVIPGAVSRRDFVIGEHGILPAAQNTGGTQIYAGYDGDGALAGVAVEAAAQGYQDIIRILYGYSGKCQCITGITVLESKETPGLGDKIAKDPEFLDNFDALDGKLNENGTGLLHVIVTVKHGKKKHPWEIDSISGATVSSKAIGKMLNESAQRLFPKLVANFSAFEQRETDDVPESE